jgi:voltage-gated potassium channel
MSQDSPTPQPRRRWISRDALVTVAVFVALSVLFLTVPLSRRDGNDWWMLLLAVAAFVLLAASVVRMVTHGETLFQLLNLLLIVVAVVSLGFYAVAINSPGEFEGIETRVDALYFTLTTMTTTGYGDIHATGQLGRLLVSLVFVFDLIFLAVLGTQVANMARQARNRRAAAHR